MSRNHEKGRCCSESFCRFPNHALNPTHKCVECKMIVHMLCSVVGDDSDDRIRIWCLLCNFDVDSDDDEADVQKSDDDEASIEKSDDDEAAIEISDEEVDIESCDEEYVERVPDPRVWTKVQIRGKEGAVKWGNKFTKKMLSFLPEEEYGMKYSDEIIKEWTKELKGTGQSCHSD